ncbi:GGDEF-domain containing protein [Psychromonas sp. psych-6C06]|uniref:putative bifunctional diguanylate cyclase/phosphodiesterase n=1 Tax=Psychromonas sp. psych-6C06 TaxID=2058089 RepID=UPI000C329EDC|nr:EAL domain-containing protein [Psychromonas sp. psych-6C06]PKF61744.1 GGDEF-domain containing protein [Psychromonas sp. psych-6C06]
MTKLPKFISSKTAIIIAAVVLAAYLILVLTVVNLGQNKLKESQHSELELKVAHYAYALSYFFDVSQDNIRVLSVDQTINTFFHNRNAGMSMAYGLGTSLFKLKKLLKQLVVQRRIDNIPIFKQVSLFNLDGNAIVNNSDTPLTLTVKEINKLRQKERYIQVTPTGNTISIRLLQLIYLNGEPIAYLVAEISNAMIIQQLTAQEHLGSGSRIELTSDRGNLFIWDSLNKATNHHLNKQLLQLNQAISMTPFTLRGWYEPVNNKDLFTSHWFVLVLSLMAIPVTLGLYFLLRIEHNNTVLQTQVSLSELQQQQLSIHNYQLEKEVSKRKASEKVLEYQATHDSLTDLANRNYSLKKLADAIELSKRHHSKILLMFIDLDNFKHINDTLGHSAGDQVLIESSERLLASVRKTDTVARLGGDEFLLILPDLKNNQQATVLAADILQLFEQPFHVQGHEFFTSTSIGLSIYPQDGDNPDTLLKCADMALYRVKDNGRNSFSFYNPIMNNNILRNVSINRRLRYAIENNKLEMYYQPLVDLHSGKILGAEALMRWTDEELGFVPPDEFILLAERNGLIHQLGDFALTEACQHAAKWQTIAPIQIAVNFSSVQFRDSHGLLAKIIAVLDATGLPHDKLDVEVTESLLINQEDELSSMLAEVRRLGIHLSIDDFGTGYSALSYLQKYAFSKLKIDRAFVMNLADNESDRSLVTAIIAMAKALKLKVVAEGIEEQLQADFLKDLDCEYGQGYLFSRPLPADAFEKLLIADNS